MAILVVAPLSASFRFAIPLLAWGIHIAMDAIQIEYLGVASVVEILFMLGLLGILLIIEIRNFQIYQIGRKTNVSGFFSWELEKMTSFFLNSFAAGKLRTEQLRANFNPRSPQ
jgi:hypothetical protein